MCVQNSDRLSPAVTMYLVSKTIVFSVVTCDDHDIRPRPFSSVISVDGNMRRNAYLLMYEIEPMYNACILPLFTLFTRDSCTGRYC